MRYCWFGQMSPGEMLPGQLSPWQLTSVLDAPRYLLLKFGQNRVSNSWDIRWGVLLLLLLLLLLGKVKPTPSSTGTELQTGTELGKTLEWVVAGRFDTYHQLFTHWMKRSSGRDNHFSFIYGCLLERKIFQTRLRLNESKQLGISFFDFVCEH